MSFFRGVKELPAALVHHTGSMIRFTTVQLPNLPKSDRTCTVIAPDGQSFSSRFHLHPANPYIGGKQLIGWIKTWVQWNKPIGVVIEQKGTTNVLHVRMPETIPTSPRLSSYVRKTTVKLAQMGRRRRIRREYKTWERDPKLRKLLLMVWENKCQVDKCKAHVGLPGNLLQAIVEVHHLNHISTGGSDSPVNLCLLCATHHSLIHHATESKLGTSNIEKAEVIVDGLTLVIKRDVRKIWQALQPPASIPQPG